MSNQIRITGSAWATTGAADATSTGLAVVTGLTHSVTTSRMSGDNGASVLISAINTACTFRIGPAVGATAPFADDAYCTLKFKVRARVELPGSLPADGAIDGWQLLDENAPGFLVYLSNVYGGLRFYLQQFSSGASYQPIFDPIPYGEWLEVTLRMKKSATGVAELWLNGALISTVTGDFSSLGAGMTWSWPALPGGVWEFAGNFEQWSGTDCPITLRSDLDSPLDEIERYFVPYGDSRINPDATLAAIGRDATVTTVSGSPSWAYAPVSTGGTNPRQTFVTVTGSGAVERREYAGTFSFLEGFGGIYFPMLYMPSGTTATLKIYSDTKLLQTLTITGGSIYQGGSIVAPFATTTRNALALIVGKNGTLDLLAADQSSTTTNGDPYLSCTNLPDWSGGTPNRFVLETTLGASGFQMCGAALFNWLRVTGVDSMVAGLASNISAPGYQVGTNITSGIFLSEALAIPGVRPFNIARGGGRQCGFNLGRSGQTYAQWCTNVLAPLSIVRGGVKLAIYEGGINEVAQATTLATAKTAVDTIATCDAAVLAWVNAYPGRRAVIGSIIERSLATHWAGSPSTTIVGARLSAIRQANRNRRTIFAPTLGARHAYIDVAGAIRWENHAAIIDTSNPPHFTGEGSSLYYANVADAEPAIPRGTKSVKGNFDSERNILPS